MAKGGRVKGIRTKAPLRENAQRIIGFRLHELLQWRHALSDPAAVSDLHDMRIAAKRLRYALEIFDTCFPVKVALNRLTAIQESVGDIHDLDVLTDIIRERLARVDAETETQAVAIATESKSSIERGNQLRRLLYAQARDRRRLGLLGLLGDYTCQRAALYTEFQEKWGGAALDAFSSQVLEAVGLAHSSDSVDEVASDQDAESMKAECATAADNVLRVVDAIRSPNESATLVEQSAGQNPKDSRRTAPP